MKPKISVVIPIYNVEKYLSKCLDSVLAQTLTDWEAICVNDGSPDGCGKILEQYAAKDKRFKIITQENQGLSMARNNGLKQAEGDYIFFLDSDDYVHPQLLEICYALAQKEAADMVSFKFQQVTQDEAIVPPKYQPDQLKYILTKAPLYYQKRHHKHKISVNSWSKFFKRELLKDLNFIPGITMEDYPHTYAILAKHPKTVILDTPLYYYVYNPKSISYTDLTVKKIQDFQCGLNAIIDLYNRASPSERRFVLHELFPNILKQQLNKIRRSSKEKQPELYAAFTAELIALNKKGYIRFWGHKISRYWRYKKLIRDGSK